MLGCVKGILAERPLASIPVSLPIFGELLKIRLHFGGWLGVPADDIPAVIKACDETKKPMPPPDGKWPRRVIGNDAYIGLTERRGPRARGLFRNARHSHAVIRLQRLFRWTHSLRKAACNADSAESDVPEETGCTYVGDLEISAICDGESR